MFRPQDALSFGSGRLCTSGSLGYAIGRRSAEDETRYVSRSAGRGSQRAGRRAVRPLGHQACEQAERLLRPIGGARFFRDEKRS